MLEDKMNNPFGDDAMDLGSSDFNGMFEDADLDKLFGSGDDKIEQANELSKAPPKENISEDMTLTENVSEEIAPIQKETSAQVKETEEKSEEAKTEREVQTETVQPTAQTDDKLEDDSDIYASAIANAEEKELSSKKESLTEKLPIFVYGKAKEEIVDTSITFEALRVKKAEDFPELDDDENVSWKVTYGSITKKVTIPKDTIIASFKKKIEESKEFSDAIKKAKDELKCEITPSIKAKKKGVMSAYKGLYETIDTAQMSGKAISYVPSEDGKLYEIRSSEVGTFIARTKNANVFKKVRDGFIPALPKIPFSVLSEILSFFKSYVTNDWTTEALAYIFWSRVEKRYFVHIPKQIVSKAGINTEEMPLEDENFILVMEIHSHNTMPAYFSGDDDKDEKVTGIYAVAGNFNKVFPDIRVRISVGGKFVEIPPEDVFECIDGVFPEKWREAVTIEKNVNLEGKQ